MTFKNAQVELEFRGTPLLLRFICLDFDNYSNVKFAINPVMTRVLENIAGDSGVHEDYRGVDFRDQFEDNHLYTNAQIIDILSYINSKYARNDGKPSMIHHSFQGAPFHFHIQIASLTKAYMPK